MVTWLPALFTGLGAALLGGAYNEVRRIQRGITNLIERVAKIEGRMER